MPSEMTALDRVFHTLSNATRRAVVSRLGKGPATMTELAEPFDIALSSFLQHLQVLEASGLVSSVKIGRVRTYRLEPQNLLEAEHWMETHRRQWTARLDQFDDFLKARKDAQP